MFMSGYELIDPSPNLAAISDRSSDRNFRSSTKGTSENFERDVALLERAKEGAVCEFSLDVCTNIVWSNGSRCQITLGVLRIWRGREGKIPSKFQHVVDLISVEITLKGRFPSSERKGRTRQRNPEAVHIGR